MNAHSLLARSSRLTASLLALAAFATFAALPACGGSTKQPVDADKPPEAPHDGRIGVHGMVVFGPSKEGGVYFSLIPSYVEPQDVQMVGRAHVTVQAGDYLPADLASGLFTMEPDSFSLDRMMTGQVRTVQGNLYQGNFMEGAQRLAHAARIDIDSTVMPARPLDTAGPKTPEPTYMAFNTSKDMYLVHILGGAPDFDQILYARSPAIDDSALKAGLSLTYKGHKNEVRDRVKAGDKPTLVLPDGHEVKVEIVRELECLTGDNFAQHCPSL